MLVFKETLFYLIIAPKSNGSDAGNLVTLKGSCKKVKVYFMQKSKSFQLNKKKNHILRLLRSVVKANFLSMKLQR